MTNRQIPFTILSIISLAAISACGNASEEQQAAFVNTTTKGSADQLKQVPTAMNLTEQMESAKADLATRLNVDESEISLLQSKTVTWRSSAAG